MPLFQGKYSGVNKMKIVILDDWNKAFTNHPALERLRRLGEVELYQDPLSFDQLKEVLKTADIVIPIRERTKFTKELLENCPRLKMIAQTGKGVAHIDLDAVNERKIPISVTPGGSATAVTELTLGLIIACLRKIPFGQRELQKGHWPHLLGREMTGKKLGIIGLGTIGSKVAKLAKVFDMSVYAWGPRLTRERAMDQGVNYLSLEELLKTVDILTLHVRLVKETTNLLTKKHFQLMKPEAILINTSRGKIVNEEDLIWALKNQVIAGAGLDVFSVEPIQPDNPLLQLDNVVLSPHIGYTTQETFDRFLLNAIENIESFVQGQPINILNEEVLK